MLVIVTRASSSSGLIKCPVIAHIERARALGLLVCREGDGFARTVQSYSTCKTCVVRCQTKMAIIEEQLVKNATNEFWACL
jgi:hypothetical protein